MKIQINKFIRKSHRYLGIFLGVQFLLWTISGMYFSWTNIDEIHGDQFMNTAIRKSAFDTLLSPTQLAGGAKIQSIELRVIGDQPYYWVNEKALYNARNGEFKPEINRVDAINIAREYVKPGLEIKNTSRITSVDKHHEYRGRPLPAYVIDFEHPENLKAYISAKDGKFQRVRHRAWRWFDFLWMTHTMDFEGRDNFNKTLLRIFSLLGLITVLSGFVLWFISSPTVRTIKKSSR